MLEENSNPRAGQPEAITPEEKGYSTIDVKAYKTYPRISDDMEAETEAINRLDRGDE